MAVYAISDIHGNLTAFRELISKAGVKFNGTDELHILGDLTDFGKESCETVLFVDKLRKQYPFVHAYLGNHDLMFSDAIENGDNSELSVYFTNWANNGGCETLEQFEGLSELERGIIRETLNTLEIENKGIMINGVNYYLTHSYPMVKQLEVRERYEQRITRYSPDEHRAVWKRQERYEKPEYPEGTPEGTVLVHGHTIVENFGPNEEETEFNSISFYEKSKKLEIDCGAKGLRRGAPYRLGLADLTNFKAWYSNEETAKDIVRIKYY